MAIDFDLSTLGWNHPAPHGYGFLAANTENGLLAALSRGVADDQTIVSCRDTDGAWSGSTLVGNFDEITRVAGQLVIWDATRFLTSDDCRLWNQMPGTPFDSIREATGFGSSLVVLADDGSVWVSDDLIQFRQILDELSEFTDLLAASPTEVLVDRAQGTILRSTNLIDWNPVSVPGQLSLRDLVYTGEDWLAQTGGGILWRSETGESWLRWSPAFDPGTNFEVDFGTAVTIEDVTWFATRSAIVVAHGDTLYLGDRFAGLSIAPTLVTLDGSPVALLPDSRVLHLDSQGFTRDANLSHQVIGLSGMARKGDEFVAVGQGVGGFVALFARGDTWGSVLVADERLHLPVLLNGIHATDDGFAVHGYGNHSFVAESRTGSVWELSFIPFSLYSFVLDGELVVLTSTGVIRKGPEGWLEEDSSLIPGVLAGASSNGEEVVVWRNDGRIYRSDDLERWQLEIGLDEDVDEVELLADGRLAVLSDGELSIVADGQLLDLPFGEVRSIRAVNNDLIVLESSANDDQRFVVYRHDEFGTGVFLGSMSWPMLPGTGESPIPEQAFFDDEIACLLTSVGGVQCTQRPENDEPLEAGFDFDQIDQLEIAFFDTSSGRPDSWSWDFGDGSSSSSSPHPVHTFPVPGAYRIRLTAFRGETSSLTEGIALVEIGQPPVAAFEANTLDDLTWQLLDRSDRADRWLWKLGGGESFERNPRITPWQGTTTVELEVENAFGSAQASGSISRFGSPLQCRPGLPILQSSFFEEGSLPGLIDSERHPVVLTDNAIVFDGLGNPQPLPFEEGPLKVVDLDGTLVALRLRSGRTEIYSLDEAGWQYQSTVPSELEDIAVFRDEYFVLGATSWRSANLQQWERFEELSSPLFDILISGGSTLLAVGEGARIYDGETTLEIENLSQVRSGVWTGSVYVLARNTQAPATLSEAGQLIFIQFEGNAHPWITDMAVVGDRVIGTIFAADPELVITDSSAEVWSIVQQPFDAQARHIAGGERFLLADLSDDDDQRLRFFESQDGSQWQEVYLDHPSNLRLVESNGDRAYGFGRFHGEHAIVEIEADGSYQAWPLDALAFRWPRLRVVDGRVVVIVDGRTFVRNDDGWDEGPELPISGIGPWVANGAKMFFLDPSNDRVLVGGLDWRLEISTFGGRKLYSIAVFDERVILAGDGFLATTTDGQAWEEYPTVVSLGRLFGWKDELYALNSLGQLVQIDPTSLLVTEPQSPGLQSLQPTDEVLYSTRLASFDGHRWLGTEFDIGFESISTGLGFLSSQRATIARIECSPKQLDPDETSRLSVIPAVVRGPGLEGSQWTSSLMLDLRAREGNHIYVLESEGGQNPDSLTFMSSQISLYSKDVLGDFRGDDGLGALLIDEKAPVVWSHAASWISNDGPNGRFGQGVPRLRVEWLDDEQVIVGARSDLAFRTNVGIVNPHPWDNRILVDIIASDGSLAGHRAVPMAPFSHRQLNGWLEDFEPFRGSLELSGEHSFASYVSVIDNVSGDPSLRLPIILANELWIPVVAAVDGANSSRWRSDVELYNPAPDAVTVELEARPFGLMPAASTSITIELPPLSTTPFDNVLEQDLGGNGAATLVIRSATPIGASSRTYSVQQDGSTFGQVIPSVLRFGQATTRIALQGLSRSSENRSNLGLVNRCDDRDLELEIFAQPTGGVRTDGLVIDLPRGVSMQLNDLDLLNEVEGGRVDIEGHYLDLRCLLPYLSVVNNQTNDPIFLLPEPELQLSR